MILFWLFQSGGTESQQHKELLRIFKSFFFFVKFQHSIYLTVSHLTANYSFISLLITFRKSFCSTPPEVYFNKTLVWSVYVRFARWLANTMRVNCYFPFPALKTLTHNYRPRVRVFEVVVNQPGGSLFCWGLAVSWKTIYEHPTEVWTVASLLSDLLGCK